MSWDFVPDARRAGEGPLRWIVVLKPAEPMVVGPVAPRDVVMQADPGARFGAVTHVHVHSEGRSTLGRMDSEVALRTSNIPGRERTSPTNVHAGRRCDRR